MNGQELAASLKSGRRVYGTLIVSPSPQWCDAIRSTGIDFVFIDTEHMALDRLTLSWMCRAYRALQLAPVVRIPEPDPFQAAMVLDGGASGVIAPYVETVEQVRALYGAVKLRPLKGKRLQAALEGEPLTPEVKQYLSAYNAGNVLIVNIESTPALDVLKDIVAVPGLDAVLVGPHDLSVSLGLPQQYAHPHFEQAITTIIGTARTHNVGAGFHYWLDMEDEIRWAKAGANLIVHHGDLFLVQSSLRRDLQQLRAVLGDGEGQQQTFSSPV